MVEKDISQHLSEIREIYVEIKEIIQKRLGEFELIWKDATDELLFEELVFCLLTPQSSAKNGMAAVDLLKEHNLLFSGEFEDIREYLNIVRFRNNKANYILEARDMFYGAEKKSIRKILVDQGSIFNKRTWIVENIKGIGYKEASHFLRNIGLGSDLAILDRHILRNMKYLGIIDDIPKSITPKIYIKMEKKLSAFAIKQKIPMNHIDLLFWYREAESILK